MYTQLNKQITHQKHGLITKLASLPAVTNQSISEKEFKYLCYNFKPLPVALARGKGIYAWDVEGKKYMDFLCGYSVNNMGHSHPKLVKATIEQVKKITQPSRAFHNEQIGDTAEFLCKTFGYDKMLPMNTGVEACETVAKIARRWGY
jgi:ornithine--oxo-acid transaminase